MNRKAWMGRRGNSAESTRCDTGEICLTIIDRAGRSGEGFALAEEDAFKAALSDYRRKNHRADLTTAKIAGRTAKPVAL